LKLARKIFSIVNLAVISKEVFKDHPIPNLGVMLVWFGLVWFGLVWFGLVWFGFALLCFNKIEKEDTRVPIFSDSIFIFSIEFLFPLILNKPTAFIRSNFKEEEKLS